MIIKRVWLESYGNREYRREGYYLLGLLPLYIRDVDPSERYRATTRFWRFRRLTLTKTGGQ